MHIEFDFREEHSRIFGPILRPVARVIFSNGDAKFAEHLYVDSGADVSLIPKSVGDALGFAVEKTDEILEVKGVGERGVPIVIKKVKIEIGEKIMEIKIGWALIEEVPLLLGRTDIFNLFNISFEKNRKTIFSE